MPESDRDDAARLRAVAETAKALGMRVHAIAVGDVRVSLAEPWGAAAESESEHIAPEEARIRELRRRSKLQFGKELPDEMLKRMDGVL